MFRACGIVPADAPPGLGLYHCEVDPHRSVESTCAYACRAVKCPMWDKSASSRAIERLDGTQPTAAPQPNRQVGLALRKTIAINALAIGATMFLCFFLGSRQMDTAAVRGSRTVSGYGQLLISRLSLLPLHTYHRKPHASQTNHEAYPFRSFAPLVP